MAIYNIPVTWNTTYDGGTMPRVDKSVGTIVLSIGEGNAVSGMWAKFISRGRIVNDPTVEQWNVMRVTIILKQGETTNQYVYDKDGSYYPNYVYGIECDLSTVNLIPTSGSYTCTVDPRYAQFESLSLPSTIPLDITSIEVEKPFNFTKIGTSIYNDLTVNFNLLSTNNVDYQVIQNELELMKADNVSTKQIIIPKGTIKTNDSIAVKVRSRFVFQGTTYFSDWVTYSVSGLADFIAPEIDNLRYVGADKIIEEPMKIAWENLDTIEGSNVKYTFEAWQDGYLIHNHIGIGAEYTIPSDTIKSTNTVTVKVFNTATYLTYTAKSSVKSLSISGLTSIKPVITDITLDGTNRDYDITVVPTCTGADRYRVNGRNGLIIPRGTLLSGINKITLEAIKDTSDSREIVAVYQKDITITQDMPQIYSLEPNGLNVNTSQDVPITFVVNESFIDSFKLTYAGQSVTGISNRKHIVAPGVFAKATNTITLEVSYTPKYVGATTRTVNKTVSFYGFGKPSNPTITESTVYKSPLPTISWNTLTASDSEIQTGYRILIKQGNTVIESVEVKGIESEHTLTHELTNHTTYDIELNVQNKYFLWSDTLKHSIETNFNELPIVNFDLFENGNSVLVKTSLESTIPIDFEQLKVYRKENKEWVLLADKLLTSDIVVDTSVRTMVPVEYKVRLYDKFGAFSESDTKSITLKKSSFIFALPPKLEESFDVKYISSTISFNTDKKLKLFAKRKAPKTYTGNIQYATLQLIVTIERSRVQEFMNLLDNECLLYRDIRGNKYYVNGTVESKKPVNHMYDELSVTLIETEYDESLMFSPESLRQVALLDGLHLLNGERYLRGQSSW